MASSLNGYAPSTNGHHSNGVLQEKHSFKFRGVFLPAEVVHQLIEGNVTKTDLKLLILIESLVTCRGDGCWASNAYLARSIQAAELSIPRSIKKLMRAGLLIRYEKDGKRYLETTWSRAADGVNRTVKEANRAVNPGLTGRLTKSNDKDEGLLDERGGSPRNGFSEGEEAGSPEDVAAAEKLKEALRTNNRRVEGWNHAGWSETFRLLREKDKQDYRPVLDWYCLNSSREKQDQLKLPSICNAKQFRKHFEWISDVMRRMEKKCPYPTIKIGAVTYAKVPTIDGHAEIPLDELPRYLRNQNRVGSRYED